MATFGPLLRQTRDARGVSLDDVSRVTRLSKRYLQALEEEAIAKLPGGNYNRAYLRTYAIFLGLQPDDVLRDYVAEEGRQSVATEQDLLATMNRAIERRAARPKEGLFARAAERPWGQIVSIAALVLGVGAVIGGAAWFGLRETLSALATRTEVASTMPPPETTAPAAVEAAPALTAPEPPVEPPPAIAPPAPEASPAAAPAAPNRATSSAAPKTAARPAPRAAARSHLSVAGSGVGTSIVNRQLAGAADRFAVGSRVVFWTHVKGGRAGDTIDHVWFRDGALVGAASLTVGSADWRTQSRRRLEPSGNWVVEARDADGRVLARHEFRASR